jgi:hypothetical protein
VGYFELFLTSNRLVEKAGPLVIHIALPTRQPTDRPTVSVCNKKQEVDAIKNKRIQSIQSSFKGGTENVVELFSSNDLFSYYGCFLTESIPNQNDSLHSINSGEQSLDDWISMCHNSCSDANEQFAVTKTKCFCITEPPATRIGFGECILYQHDTCLDDEDFVSAYILNYQGNCDQSGDVRTFRNRLTDLQQAIPLGFEIITNTFVDSPFQLYKKQCETNMYSLSNDVSQVATSIKTSNETITNYANEERNQFSSKLRVALYSVILHFPYTLHEEYATF